MSSGSTQGHSCYPCASYFLFNQSLIKIKKKNPDALIRDVPRVHLIVHFDIMRKIISRENNMTSQTAEYNSSDAAIPNFCIRISAGNLVEAC